MRLTNINVKFITLVKKCLILRKTTFYKFIHKSILTFKYYFFNKIELYITFYYLLIYEL